MEQFGAQVRQVGVLVAGLDQELQSGGAEPVGAVDHDRRRVTRPPVLDVDRVAETLVEEAHRAGTVGREVEVGEGGHRRKARLEGGRGGERLGVAEADAQRALAPRGAAAEHGAGAVLCHVVVTADMGQQFLEDEGLPTAPAALPVDVVGVARDRSDGHDVLDRSLVPGAFEMGTEPPLELTLAVAAAVEPEQERVGLGAFRVVGGRQQEVEPRLAGHEVAGQGVVRQAGLLPGTRRGDRDNGEQCEGSDACELMHDPTSWLLAWQALGGPAPPPASGARRRPPAGWSRQLATAAC